MKKILNLILLSVAMLSLNSCLKSNLDDLPAFADAEISSVRGVQYRYYSDDMVPGTTDPIVKNISLGVTSEVSSEAGTIAVNLTTPSSFPAGELGNLSRSNLVVYVAISTAARIAPINGAPVLGVPGDWTRENQYMVTAADGTTKVWTIHIESLTK